MNAATAAKRVASMLKAALVMMENVPWVGVWTGIGRGGSGGRSSGSSSSSSSSSSRARDVTRSLAVAGAVVAAMVLLLLVVSQLQAERVRLRRQTMVGKGCHRQRGSSCPPGFDNVADAETGYILHLPTRFNSELLQLEPFWPLYGGGDSTELQVHRILARSGYMRLDATTADSACQGLRSGECIVFVPIYIAFFHRLQVRRGLSELQAVENVRSFVDDAMAHAESVARHVRGGKQSVRFAMVVPSSLQNLVCRSLRKTSRRFQKGAMFLMYGSTDGLPQCISASEVLRIPLALNVSVQSPLQDRRPTRLLVPSQTILPPAAAVPESATEASRALLSPMTSAASGQAPAAAGKGASAAADGSGTHEDEVGGEVAREWGLRQSILHTLKRTKGVEVSEDVALEAKTPSAVLCACFEWQSDWFNLTAIANSNGRNSSSSSGDGKDESVSGGDSSKRRSTASLRPTEASWKRKWSEGECMLTSLLSGCIPVVSDASAGSDLVGALPWALPDSCAGQGHGHTSAGGGRCDEGIVYSEVAISLERLRAEMPTDAKSDEFGKWLPFLLLDFADDVDKVRPIQEAIVRMQSFLSYYEGGATRKLLCALKMRSGAKDLSTCEQEGLVPLSDYGALLTANGAGDAMLGLYGGDGAVRRGHHYPQRGRGPWCNRDSWTQEREPGPAYVRTAASTSPLLQHEEQQQRRRWQQQQQEQQLQEPRASLLDAGIARLRMCRPRSSPFAAGLMHWDKWQLTITVVEAEVVHGARAGTYPPLERRGVQMGVTQPAYVQLLVFAEDFRSQEQTRKYWSHAYMDNDVAWVAFLCQFWNGVDGRSRTHQQQPVFESTAVVVTNVPNRVFLHCPLPNDDTAGLLTASSFQLKLVSGSDKHSVVIPTLPLCRVDSAVEGTDTTAASLLAGSTGHSIRSRGAGGSAGIGPQEVARPQSRQGALEQHSRTSDHSALTRKQGSDVAICLRPYFFHQFFAKSAHLDPGHSWERLREYVDYHLLLDVPKIYFYDRYGEEFMGFIRPYLRSGTMVHVPFPFLSEEYYRPFSCENSADPYGCPDAYDQLHSAEHCVMQGRSNGDKWLIFTDIDEYLEVPTYSTVPQFLKAVNGEFATTGQALVVIYVHRFQFFPDTKGLIPLVLGNITRRCQTWMLHRFDWWGVGGGHDHDKLIMNPWRMLGVGSLNHWVVGAPPEAEAHVSPLLASIHHYGGGAMYPCRHRDNKNEVDKYLVQDRALVWASALLAQCWQELNDTYLSGGRVHCSRVCDVVCSAHAYVV